MSWCFLGVIITFHGHINIGWNIHNVQSMLVVKMTELTTFLELVLSIKYIINRCAVMVMKYLEFMDRLLYFDVYHNEITINIHRKNSQWVLLRHIDCYCYIFVCYIYFVLLDYTMPQ